MDGKIVTLEDEEATTLMKLGESFNVTAARRPVRFHEAGEPKIPADAEISYHQYQFLLFSKNDGVRNPKSGDGNPIATFLRHGKGN